MPQKYLEFLVLIANPADFSSWPAAAKIDRYERVIEWHDFIARSNPIRVPYVWGTHQVLSHTELSKSLTRNWWFSCASEAAGDKLDAGNHEPGESAFK